MEPELSGRLEQTLLVHLLEHRGHQVRFEADQWTTEFGILRAFDEQGSLAVKTALRMLEVSRLIYRRVQYVIGYSEPKLVYSLTPAGHRKALDLVRERTNADLGTHSEPAPRSDGGVPGFAHLRAGGPTRGRDSEIGP